jgi:hypothetical protein
MVGGDEILIVPPPETAPVMICSAPLSGAPLLMLIHAPRGW